MEHPREGEYGCEELLIWTSWAAGKDKDWADPKKVGVQRVSSCAILGRSLYR